MVSLLTLQVLDLRIEPAVHILGVGWGTQCLYHTHTRTSQLFTWLSHHIIMSDVQMTNNMWKVRTSCMKTQRNL